MAIPIASSSPAPSGSRVSLGPVTASSSQSLSLPGCGVAPPSAATESLTAVPWPRGRALAGVDAGWVAVLAPPMVPLDGENWPSPLGKEPVDAAIWLRLMSVQFRVAFRQLVTSHCMTAGLQAFQKSACIENWLPLESESRELETPRTVFQRTRIPSDGRPTGWETGQAPRTG